jgi:hypothetical protein
MAPKSYRCFTDLLFLEYLSGCHNPDRETTAHLENFQQTRARGRVTVSQTPRLCQVRTLASVGRPSNSVGPAYRLLHFPPSTTSGAGTVRGQVYTILEAAHICTRTLARRYCGLASFLRSSGSSVAKRSQFCRSRSLGQDLWPSDWDEEGTFTLADRHLFGAGLIPRYSFRPTGTMSGRYQT